jgi:fructose-1-phosphate kinase PfkB-like protein
MLEDELLPRCGRAIVAGSVPAGIDPRGHAAIVEVARAVGRPLLVDVAGVGLVAALGALPDVVKVGRVEVEESGIVGVGATTLEAATSLVERGARTAIVTDGPNHVAAADAEWAWRIDVPQLKAVNAVGSGDCFNAAWSLALLEGASMETALARGVAAGSANALALGAGMLDPDLARRLEGDVRVTRTRR